MRRAARWAGAHWRPALLLATLGLLWGGLYRNPSPLTLVALIVAGIVCGLALARSSRTGWVVATGALAFGVAVAAGRGPAAYLHSTGWSALGPDLREGFVEVVGARFPAQGPGAFALGLILVVLAAGLVVLSRRVWPIGAALAVLAVAGYRWTVAPAQSATLSGLAISAVVVLVVGGQARRSLTRRTAGILAMCGLGALGSLAVATDRPVLDWRTWDVVARAAQPQLVVSLAQTYGQLNYPDRPVVMFRVSSERAVELRGAVFPHFDGAAFDDDSPPPERLNLTGGSVTLDSDGSGARLTQRVTQVSAETNLLFASGRPGEIRGLPWNRRLNRIGASLQVEPDLPRGATYTIDTTVPDPGAAALEAAGPPSGGDITIDLPGGREVVVPSWGSGRTLPAADQFGVYAPVADLAREIALGARSEYEVVVATENYLRESHSYSEAPPTPVGDTPWIVDFLTRSRTGFCQQFANSMALMLQMNGIPARVAVGFTRGAYDAARGDFVIVDRDAHSWVEVDFSGYGWLPFDPTPGRSAANSASVSSRSFSLSQIRLAALRARLPQAAVKPAPIVEPPKVTPTFPAAPVGDASGFGARWLLLAAPFLLIGAIPVAKSIRRARRRRAGSPRERILAAGREFAGWLRELGLDAGRGHTASRRSEDLAKALGVDASDLVTRIEAARFGGSSPSMQDAQGVWTELTALRSELRRAAGPRRWLRSRLGLRSLRA